MNALLARAVLYRLFAQGNRPGALLVMRMISLILITFGIAAVVYSATPSGHLADLHYPKQVLLSLMIFGIYTFVTLCFILLNAQQRDFLARLTLLDYVPLASVQRRAFCYLAYAPTSLLVVAVAVTAACRFFGDAIEWSLCIALLTALGSAAVNILLRVTKSRITKFPQLVSAASLLAAVLAAWQATRFDPERYLPTMFNLVFVATLLTLILHLSGRPLRNVDQQARSHISEHLQLGIMGAFCLRAIRSKRYMMANIVVLTSFTSLSLVALHDHKALPFDAVAVLTLLLTGTLAQEIRSLSKSPYPLEILQYGQLGRWVIAHWVLLFTNIAVIIDLILLCARWLFAGQLGASVPYILCIGFAFAAAGALSSAITAPRKNDILTQLQATLLYGLLVWMILRIAGNLEDAPILMLVIGSAGLIAASVITSLGIEKFRWLRTILWRSRPYWFRQ